MMATGSKLVMIVLTVVVAVTTVAGARTVAWAQTWNDAAGERSDRPSYRDVDREVPGICGTPWVSDPRAIARQYMTLPPKDPFQLELGLVWRRPALLRKVEVDIDGDGRIDIIYFDRNGDGKWDAAWLLNQPEGVYVWDDTNGDGKVQRDEVYLLDPFQTC